MGEDWKGRENVGGRKRTPELLDEKALEKAISAENMTSFQGNPYPRGERRGGNVKEKIARSLIVTFLMKCLLLVGIIFSGLY